MSRIDSKFHFIMAVWGTSYVEVFLNVVLPTQLSDGNLGAVPFEGTRYKIYTTQGDERTIRESPAYQALASRLTVDFISIDPLLKSAEWAKTTDAQEQYFLPMQTVHRMAIEEAGRDPAVCLVFLAPDCVFADGTFRFIVEAAGAGKRAVLTHSLRVDLRAFREALEREVTLQAGTVRKVPPRKLVDLILRYPHPVVAGLTWKGSVRQHTPTHMLFPAGKSALISRGIHLHPVMVRPNGSPVLPAHFIDYDYIDRLRIAPGEIAVATDSDQAIGCEMSLREQHLIYIDQAPEWTTRRIGHYIANIAPRFHRMCLGYTVFLHADGSVEGARQAEAEAEAVVAEIRKWRLVYWLLPFPGFYRLWLAAKIPLQRRWGRAGWYLGLKKLKVALAQRLLGKT